MYKMCSLVYTTLLLILLLPSATATLGRVVGLRLHRAPGGEFVTNLSNGMTLYLNGTTPSYTIVAVTNRRRIYRSIRFGWNDTASYRTAKKAPYALCGPSYAPCDALQAGRHTVSAAVGRGTPYKISFVISDSVAPTTPTPPTVVPPSPTPSPVTRPSPVTVTLPSPTIVIPPVPIIKNPPSPTVTPPAPTLVNPPSPTLVNPPSPAVTPPSPSIVNPPSPTVTPPSPTTVTPPSLKTPSPPSPTVTAPRTVAPPPPPVPVPRMGPVSPPVPSPMNPPPVPMAPTVAPVALAPVSQTDPFPTAAPLVSLVPAPLASPVVEPLGPSVAPLLAPLIPTVALLPTVAPRTPTVTPFFATIGPRFPTVPPRVATIAPPPFPTMTPRLGPTATPTARPTFAPQAVFEPILINCAGGPYIDTNRRLWIADDYWTGGLGPQKVNTSIDGTSDDTLFQTYRYGEAIYNIPLGQGLYEVVLYFAETFFDAEYNRVFDVTVEKTRLSEIDLVGLGGGLNNMAITRTFSAVVVDGFLTIRFFDDVNHALICAIEVNRIGDSPPTLPPVPTPPTPPVETGNVVFQTLLINCGGPRYNDTEGRLWMADRYSTGGAVYANTGRNIADTDDDFLYFSERYGDFKYDIPVPLGSYQVILHFTEIYFTTEESRVFDVNLEDEELLQNIDIVKDAGQAFKLHKVTVDVPVMDGFLTLKFLKKDPAINEPSIGGIEVRRAGDHFSHAVIGGPYKAVDVDGDGFAAVAVDGSLSHTHGPTHTVSAYTWRIGTNVVGSGKITTLNIPVGEKELTLTIVDTSGSISSDTTTVVVKQKGFPEVFSLSPETGDVAGGTLVTLVGQDIGNATSVRFGRIEVPRQDITVIDSGSISVFSPGTGVGVPVKVSVVTPIGESNTVKYTFVTSVPIDFAVSKLMNFNKPTALAFGPDGKLYVATQDGTLSRITLNDSYDTVVSSVTARIDPNRCILGIAFDPMETPEMGASISAYISTSLIYHGQPQSTFANAINGKIQKVTGPNLEIVTNIVTGLPVSELDHSVNAVYFGNNGELYIGTGSNTNAGYPGGLLGSGRQLESYFSAAVLVANLGQPTFNGFITYDAPNNGNPITGFGPNGVEIFGAGMRNPFGVTMHTNGKIYATDNGPNQEYGPKAVGCNEATDKLTGPTESDKLLLVKQGGYYGHPNHKRAEADPRQCAWQSNFLPSNSTTGYTAPLMRVPSSTCGIIEFQSDHFAGQLRGDLIVSKYNSALFRVILSADGESVNAYTNPPVELDGFGGLAVTQAPDGSLIDVRHTDGNCHIFKPVEANTTALDIKAVFPRRGGLAGNSKLMIFGVNFDGPGTVTVTVGGNQCTSLNVVSPQKIECMLPMGTLGLQSVTVTIGANSDTFVNGYRYITGLPAV